MDANRLRQGRIGVSMSGETMQDESDRVLSREVEILRDWSLAIRTEQVIRAQGMDPAHARARNPAIIALVEQALEIGPALLEPIVLTRTQPVLELKHERLIVDGGYEVSGRLVAQHLAPAEWIRVVLCTLGGGLEARIASEMNHDPPLGLALDAFGSAAIKELSTAACNCFEAVGQQVGLQSSIPLSPGMVGWPLDQGQLELFAMIDATRIGIDLTSGFQMIPRKSLSMVIGLGPEMEGSGRSCDFCSMKETCRYQDHYA
jgi:hypothetical protein